MARKQQALPADQRERLNQRYRQERDALVALANARIAVEQAAGHVAAAGDALDEARRREHDAYQEVVALVGPAAAAELSGGAPTEQPSRGRRRSAGAPAAR